MTNNEKIPFEIDGKACYAQPGQIVSLMLPGKMVCIIPSLCHVEGIKPAGSCRICNVKVNGRNMTACTTPVAEGMIVENDIPGIERTA